MGSFFKKHWLALVGALIALMCIASLGGCATVAETKDMAADSRFVVVEKTSIWRVVYDKDTKVMYAISYGGYNCGTFTLLVDADGNPLLWSGT